jgi:hypothetical protein
MNARRSRTHTVSTQMLENIPRQRRRPRSPRRLRSAGCATRRPRPWRETGGWSPNLRWSHDASVYRDLDDKVVGVVAVALTPPSHAATSSQAAATEAPESRIVIEQANRTTASVMGSGSTRPTNADARTPATTTQARGRSPGCAMAATQQPAQRRAEQRDGPRPTADLQLEPARRLLCLRTIP